MEIEVNSCADCLFSLVGTVAFGGGVFCERSNGREVDGKDYVIGVTPEWCPLRKEEITIKLK